MAYTPKTWTCGETITDAGLNNIEQGIQEALGCCESELPEVTTADNGKVLTVIDGEWDKGEGGSGGLPAVTTDDNGDILTVVDGEWEKAEPGFKCTSTSATLTEESVTTSKPDPSVPFAMGNFSYSSLINADTLTVTFNGTEYEVDRIDLSGSYGYGGMGSSGPDFTNYPFGIWSSSYGNQIYTQNEGTYSVKIVATNETVATSGCFEKAVKKFGLKYVKDANVVGGVLANDVNGNTVTAQYALAEGKSSTASGEASHAEGYYTTASFLYSHAEGDRTTASGMSSHAEGSSTTASSSGSHAEGEQSTASNRNAHAEGLNSVASGENSHAEGHSEASGNYSHAEGFTTTASGEASHAEGQSTAASGSNSHAEGLGTTANHLAQHVFGKYNIADPSTSSAGSNGTYIEIVGNGANLSSRSNARTLDWSGNETIAGTLTQSSDKRLKEHIDYLGEDAEEFIRSLKPAHYIKDDKHHVGFYAQDVEEADKWDCMTGEMNGYKTLGYTEIIAPLVAYCQSLEKRIKELENK